MAALKQPHAVGNQNKTRTTQIMYKVRFLSHRKHASSPWNCFKEITDSRSEHNIKQTNKHSDGQRVRGVCSDHGVAIVTVSEQQSQHVTENWGWSFTQFWDDSMSIIPFSTLVTINTNISPFFCHLLFSPSVSIVKPTGCTNVSNLFYLGMTLYMFLTVFPSIISSSRLYIQQQTDTAVCLLAHRQQYLFDIRLLLYVQSWTADDGRKDRPKHVEC